MTILELDITKGSEKILLQCVFTEDVSATSFEWPERMLSYANFICVGGKIGGLTINVRPSVASCLPSSILAN